MKPLLAVGVLSLLIVLTDAKADDGRTPPNIVLIVADDLGFSDLGCYGSEIATPNLDRLAASGVRFAQFHNAARCCPTRAALLTGLYPHQAGVGHMLSGWRPPAYTSGLNDKCATIAELLRTAGYRSYHVGKWHVGGVDGKGGGANHPLNRGFHRAYGTGGGGNFFAPRPLYLDRGNVEPGDDYYVTDAFSDYAVRFLGEHAKEYAGQPFFLHLCYTAPHFPLHARPEEIARYRGKYAEGWDVLRERRFARQKELGLFPRDTQLSPRDPVARAWATIPAAEREEWDLRMAVYAAMIDRMDQGIGRVLDELTKTGADRNTLVLFLSDNGASAEALDSWPNPARGHQPGSVVGTKESHRCLEVGWANAANTPFREHKMWVHEGGIATPLIVSWPVGIKFHGRLIPQVGHVIDLLPTLLEVAGVKYPEAYAGRTLTPLPGKSLALALQGGNIGDRTLGWEHEGNRAIRIGDWKLVAPWRGEWELYDLSRDHTEIHNLAAARPEKVAELAKAWQAWADDVGVVPWEQLPGSSYRPTAGYQRKSEPVPPNIVLIYADDLGYGDAGCYGATRVRTPNIDRLAREGVRFTDGHSPAATCTPSRYALMTGEYAWRKKGTGILPGDASLIIDPGRKTLASLLKRAGYATGVVGKWHLGLGAGEIDWNGEIKPVPLEVGFDQCFIIPATGDRVPCVYVENRRVAGLEAGDPIRVSYRQPLGDDPTGVKNPELLKMRPSHGHDMTIVNGISRIGYMTGGRSARWVDEDMADVLTRKAVEFVEKQKGQPFFLFFALHDIHVPRVPHPRFVGATEMGPRGDAIAELDWCTGEILAALDRLKLADNTLVIFSSDNGPVVDDGYRDDAVEKLGAHKPAGALRGGKGSAFEAGTRVPFLVRWPARIKPGVSDALVCQIDLLASLAHLSDQTLNANDAPDSVNVLPALLGESPQGRELLVEQSGVLSLRNGPWKLIEPGKGAKISRNTNIETGLSEQQQLYRLDQDPGEMHDLAAENPRIVAEMTTLLDSIRKRGRSRP